METRLQTYDFPVVLEPDEDAHGNPAWHAYCPALADIGAATSGRTKEEALRNLDEVLHMIVQERVSPAIRESRRPTRHGGPTRRR